MKFYQGVLVLTAVAAIGFAATTYAADTHDNKMQKQQQGIHKDSELGMKDTAKEGKSQRANEDRNQLGGGSLGEDSKGGAGPSGPKGLPAGKAPGFEGADREPGRAPTAGGH